MTTWTKKFGQKWKKKNKAWILANPMRKYKIKKKKQRERETTQVNLSEQAKSTTRIIRPR